mgnify:CR=1 FL=1
MGLETRWARAIAILHILISVSWPAALLGAVEDFEQRNADNATKRFFWIDVCSVNQHAAADCVLGSEHWARLFGDAIREIGEVCVVATPWRRPVPLTRCWCLS